MDQGKSSHVSSVENQVILHEIANRNGTAIKDPLATTTKDCHAEISNQHAPDKPIKKRTETQILSEG
jgi:hypothetical protein